MDLEFQWDEPKAASNKRKHSVTFEEAATVFEDSAAVIFDDEAHSQDEAREIIVGSSNKNRLLIVCFTERGETIRIISARRANKKEQRDYEENSFQ